MQEKDILMPSTSAECHVFSLQAIVSPRDWHYNIIEDTSAKILISTQERQVSWGYTNGQVSGH